ncbi:MAG: hypothetical protein WC683_18700 [bacterium]
MAKQKKPKLPNSEECFVDFDSLKPHPRNYKTHPADQIEHLRSSLRQYGFYRRVVVACDNTILCGHGLVEAAKGLGFKQVPAIRYSFGPDDPRALKLLALDNEVGRFSLQDDRALSDLLRDISTDIDIGGLSGTGYDEKMLAALVMVTRPASEIATLDRAAEWAGMPDFDPGDGTFILTIQCLNEESRTEAIKLLGIGKEKISKQRGGRILSTWYPPREKDDLISLEWKEKEDA